MKAPARYQAAYCHASAIASFIDQWLFGKVEMEEMLESLVLIADGQTLWMLRCASGSSVFISGYNEPVWVFCCDRGHSDGC
ncbi:unnamed protein product [Dibothriocephalus latus]|uniref:Uncharacterized protein n=1 Tax=Dibothriocephalus latus TaxID=60516 RepID=A0A3P6QBI9_DIBLA|nr:unnamed protein product [Dibothriocephalus latus]